MNLWSAAAERSADAALAGAERRGGAFAGIATREDRRAPPAHAKALSPLRSASALQKRRGAALPSTLHRAVTGFWKEYDAQQAAGKK